MFGETLCNLGGDGMRNAPSAATRGELNSVSRLDKRLRTACRDEAAREEDAVAVERTRASADIGDAEADAKHIIIAPWQWRL